MGTLKVLVIGSGAREHALVTALLGDESVLSVVCAPGNAGIGGIVPIIPVDASDPAEIADLAAAQGVDLVVIGPELPLVAGAADALRARGIACFGPSAAAARLEGSKAFAKEVMAEAGISTALAQICLTIEQVTTALDQFGAPYVVKDDGLAAGKGVVVTSNRGEAIEHARLCLSKSARAGVVIEEYLDGPEVSLFGISDGTTVIPLQPAQDYKRVRDGDQGPNTGGMGAYSPLLWAPETLVDDVTDGILQPMVDAMRHRGTPFVGLLYAGLALTSRGTKVIEFNARFGDPETQVVLARLVSPLGRLLMAAATGRLTELPPLVWSDDAAVTVVMAAYNYPDAPRLGDPITGLSEASDIEGVAVFHAGTASSTDGGLVSAGGRILSVTATGMTMEQASGRAYEALERITVEGAHYRKDIAAHLPIS